MAPPLKRTVVSSRTQRWVRVLIWIIAVAIFAAYGILSPLLRSVTKHDRTDAPPQSASAVVEQIVAPTIEENVKPVPAQAWVRFRGQLLPVRDVFGSAQLHIGSTAHIVYRIGKSGRVYIDSVEPLPSTKP